MTSVTATTVRKDIHNLIVRVNEDCMLRRIAGAWI